MVRLTGKTIKSNHIDSLMQLPFPLVKLIEPGIGFRIGDETREFSLAGTAGEAWTFTDSTTGLQLTAGLRIVDQVAIVSGLLENKGCAPVSGIDVLEPLRLVFRNPASAWRHIFANGGTTDSFYPPTAYRTQEWTQGSQALHIESHPEGRSSNLHLPFLISLASRAEDSEGFFCGMAWSGAWYMTFRKLDETRAGLNVGVKVQSLTLQPGETLQLPEIHIGFFRGGPARGTNALRKYLYEQVCPTYQGKPTLPRVSYDHWFGIGNSLNMDRMKQQAARAAQLGVEVFVVDAAWFPGDFPDGVGNWDQVDRAKFPDGLEPLADYVRSLGMDFGLWFEVERAVEGTAIVREHPEWFIAVPSWTHKQSYHLNLACRQAQDYVIDVVGRWIRKLDLRWSRWDYNIEPMPFWKIVDPTLKIQFEYFAGLYRVLDMLMEEHPNWMVEGCASGGRRIDIGTMKRAHTYWFSDQTAIATVCRYMQARANRFLPGHLLNSSVAVDTSASDADFCETSVLSRMLGKLAFDGDIGRWSSSLTARMGSWVVAFKAIRHLLVQDFYQLLPQPQTAEDWDAVQFVSYSGDEAIVFAFAGCQGGNKGLRLHGLRRDRTYVVTQMLDGESATISGDSLMNGGISVALQQDQGGLWRMLAESRTSRMQATADRRA